jgi:hypothetical protein
VNPQVKRLPLSWVLDAINSIYKSRHELDEQMQPLDEFVKKHFIRQFGLPALAKKEM